MKYIAAFLCAIFATVVSAESMALDFYKQCTGPAMERQARSNYARAPCHQTNTCAPFDATAYSSNVELSCYGNAFDICVVFDDVDACFGEVVTHIETRVDTLADAFPSERVSSAANLQDGFLSSGLLRALDRRHEQDQFDCSEPADSQILEVYGLSRETFCASLSVMDALNNEQDIANRTLRLEAEER